jgi:hypothetical protein
VRFIEDSLTKEITFMRSTRLARFLVPTLFLGTSLYPTFADTAHFTVTFTGTTRDLYLTAGSGNAFKGVKITGPDGKEAPPNSSKGTDPASGAHNAAWTTPPGAVTYTTDAIHCAMSIFSTVSQICDTTIPRELKWISQ